MAKEISDAALRKTATGIKGLDEITFGGLPQGRTTLVAGSAGSGKTLLGMAFLVAGAEQYDEPGVFVSFEETPADLRNNFASLGVDLDDLQAQKKIAIDYVYIERSEIEETGEYDLEGLFVRLGYAIDSVGAKRIVLDTLEALFSGLGDVGILRAELRRLFRWLKNRGVTAVVTAERGVDTLTRHGLEEYVADCVILLDMRVTEQVVTRRLRIIKYRGSAHGTNEYPFIIDEDGISVLPITSIGLLHDVSAERVSSGIKRLDAMLGGAGYYSGSSILVSGSAGSGKTTVAACFVTAACERGKRGLYFAFEESPNQIMRNMSSVGIELKRCVDKGTLIFHASRPTLTGLETHLANIARAVIDKNPDVVVFDPVTNLTAVGSSLEVQAMLTRLIDFLKSKGITSVFTALVSGRRERALADDSQVGVSSLMDTWISLRNIEADGERNRGLYVLKSRGMGHSNQIREFTLSEEGVDLADVYRGPRGVLTGTARAMQEARDEFEETLRRQEYDSKRRELDRKRTLVEAQIAQLRAQYEQEVAEIEMISSEEHIRQSIMDKGRVTAARLRGAGDEPQTEQEETGEAT